MNDSPVEGFRLLATAARIAGFPAESQWPAMLTLPQLAALLAEGCTGEQRAPFREWCTVLNLAAKSGALQTTLSQRAIPAVRRVGSIGRAPREFVPPPAPGFRAVPAVTREAAAALLQRQALPLTVAAWLASSSEPSPTLASSPEPRPPLEPEQSKTPIQWHAWQENEILRVISALGHKANALPKWERGKDGVKAEVRRKFDWTKCVFNKAWDRLRQDKRIGEAD